MIAQTRKGTLEGGLQQVSIFISGNAPQPKPLFMVEDFSETSAPSEYALMWPAVVGQRYQAQFTQDLRTPAWTNVAGEISAAKTTVSVTVTPNPASGSGFYRVIEVE